MRRPPGQNADETGAIQRLASGALKCVWNYVGSPGYDHGYGEQMLGMPDQETSGFASREQGWFYVQWHFIEMCNLRCQHCYQTSYKNTVASEEVYWTISHILDYALAVWKRRGRISLTGGEPFLIEDLLFKLLDFFDISPNFEWIGILSNGTLITSEIAKALRRYNRLREVQVSLDGVSSETHDIIRGKGAFARAIKGIRCLKEAGIPTSIMFTLSAINYKEVLPLIDLAMELEVNAITIERLIPLGNAWDKKFLLSKQELKATYEAIAQRKKELEGRASLRIRTSRPLWCLVEEDLGGFCPAGFMCLSVLHDGTLFPCRRLEIPLGNIFQDGLFKIWYTSEVLWHLRQKTSVEGKCRTCEFLGKCRGCRAAAFANNGNYLAPDPDCWKEEI